MEHVDREKHAQTKNEINSKLAGYQGDLAKGQTVIEALEKKKEALVVKIKEAETKARYFSPI